MLALDYDVLLSALAQFTYPLARVLALIAVAPLLGHPAVPRRVKLGLGVSVAALVYPLLPPPPAVDPFTAGGVALLAREILIGWLLGFAVRLVFAAVDVAGELMGLQMGLGFATFFDPQSGGQSAALGHLLDYLTMLVWLAVGGPLLLFGALAETFRFLPVAAPSLPALDLATFVSAGALVFSAALHMALPAIVALTMVNLALGVLSRAAPQMNLISIGFPVTLLVGMLAFGASLPFLMGLIERHLVASVELLLR